MDGCIDDPSTIALPWTMRFAGDAAVPIDIVGADELTYETIILRMYIVPTDWVVLVCLKLPPKCNAFPVVDVVRPLTEKLVQVVVL